MSPLFHWPEYSAYECLGCGEFIEVPLEGVLKTDAAPVPIRHNPENFLIWREMVERVHAQHAALRNVTTRVQ